MLHFFTEKIHECELPGKFTFPFCYTPHPLCVRAAQQVQQYLDKMEAWPSLSEGKMFGVLLVRELQPAEASCPEKGRIGFLAAFSGNLAGKNHYDYFVPPVYDLLNPDDFFKPQEAGISALNHDIETLLQSPEYQALLKEREHRFQELSADLEAFRLHVRERKEARSHLRALAKSDDSIQIDGPALIRESQFLKAELKRRERQFSAVLAQLDERISRFQSQVDSLKEERKVRSAQLQQEIFEKYELLNAKGERKNIVQIFEEYSDRFPPAGTGECAAPKLLQYAYLHQLQPLAMAEFWWGKSPLSQIRHQGHFYPSCHSKCEPLLTFMLEGLEVEDNPMERNMRPEALSKGREGWQERGVHVIYEDSWLLAVDKPSGILSVPGKGNAPSVWSWVHAAHPEYTGPLVIHRLDMSTSGLLLVAKDSVTYVKMQQLFEHRQIRKRYLALLGGVPTFQHARPSKGVISLPLCPDLEDRPRQMVSEAMGKEAITEYEILSVEEGHTRIAFWPITGRTHQLRVHAAHPEGLNTPILGDALYGGAPSSRLYLHAESISFLHPFTGEYLEIHCPAEF